MHQLLTKDTLRTALKQALTALQRRQLTTAQIFSAPLAVQLSKETAKLIGEKPPWKLTPEIYGPILFPARNTRDIQFRHFLDFFPDLDRDALDKTYRELFFTTLAEQIKRNSSPQVPIAPLGLWMKKKSPDLDYTQLGFPTLTSWLKSVPNVTLHGDGSVSLRDDVASQNFDQGDDKKPIGYVLIDSTDIIFRLKFFLGCEPPQNMLPDWPKVLQFSQKKWPNFAWKCHYFIGLLESEVVSMAGFLHHLKSSGIETHAFQLNDLDDKRQLLKSRLELTQSAIAKTIEMHERLDSAGAVMVASHDPRIATSLLSIQQKAKSSERVSILGFRELMPVEFLRLCMQGLRVFDLEIDCHAFRESLPGRNRLKKFDLFDPTITL